MYVYWPLFFLYQLAESYKVHYLCADKHIVFWEERLMFIILVHVSEGDRASLLSDKQDSIFCVVYST